MTAQAAIAFGNEAQREPRTNVFVMGAIYSDSGSAPVRVRNVSQHGALIEGIVIPPAGSQVRLCRGSLSVSAKIIWCEAGRAGLHFESAVLVADWLPGGRAPSHQQSVDEIIQRVRMSPLAAVPAGHAQPDRVSGGDLLRLTETIESLAEDLIGDPAVAERHLLKLQVLDLAVQTLRKLAAER